MASLFSRPGRTKDKYGRIGGQQGLLTPPVAPDDQGIMDLLDSFDEDGDFDAQALASFAPSYVAQPPTPAPILVKAPSVDSAFGSDHGTDFQADPFDNMSYDEAVEQGNLARDIAATTNGPVGQAATSLMGLFSGVPGWGLAGKGLGLAAQDAAARADQVAKEAIEGMYGTWGESVSNGREGNSRGGQLGDGPDGLGLGISAEAANLGGQLGDGPDSIGGTSTGGVSAAEGGGQSGGYGDGGADVWADGGYIEGPGGPQEDAIPARLSDGEFVIPADVVLRLGAGDQDKGAQVLADLIKTVRGPDAEQYDPPKNIPGETAPMEEDVAPFADGGMATKRQLQFGMGKQRVTRYDEFGMPLGDASVYGSSYDTEGAQDYDRKSSTKQGGVSYRKQLGDDASVDASVRGGLTTYNWGSGQQADGEVGAKVGPFRAYGGYEGQRNQDRDGWYDDRRTGKRGGLTVDIGDLQVGAERSQLSGDTLSGSYRTRVGDGELEANAQYNRPFDRDQRTDRRYMLNYRTPFADGGLAVDSTPDEIIGESLADQFIAYMRKNS